MPYNKGDFTQQGVAGDVSALVRLNEKRVMKVVLSSDDESDNCDVSGAVYDLLNGTSYPLGGSEPTGTINITENGTGIDVAQYALADVNVQGFLVKLHESNLGALSTISTSGEDFNKAITVIDGAKYDMLLHVYENTDPYVASHHYASFQMTWLYNTRDASTPQTLGSVNKMLQYHTDSSNVLVSDSSQSSVLGVYSMNIQRNNTDIKLDVFGKYNSTATTAIDGTYKVTIYGVKLSGLLTPKNV